MDTQQGTNDRTRQFSLVEMLVVVAILAILMALLMPALALARQRADRIACAGNLKQIGVGTALYRDDHEGWCLPVVWQTDPEPRFTWERTLSPYIAGTTCDTDDMPIFRCPTFGEWRTACPHVLRFQKTGGYAYNTHPGVETGGWAGVADVHEADIASPEATIEVFENRTCRCWLSHLGHGQLGWRHRRGLNLLFVDSHVKWHREIPAGWWNAKDD